MKHKRGVSVTLAIGLTLTASSLPAAGGDARIYNIEPSRTVIQSHFPTAVQKQIDAMKVTLKQAGGSDPSINAKWDVTASQLVGISFEPPATADAGGDPVSQARAFLRDHQPLFGLTPGAIDAMFAKPSAKAKQKLVVLTQSYAGIPFVDQQGQVRVALADRGGVVSVSGRYYTGADPSTAPKLDVVAAFAQVRRQLPNLWKSFDGKPSVHDGQTGKPVFGSNPRLDSDKTDVGRVRHETLIQHVGMDFTDELTAHLSFFLDGSRARLVWEFGTGNTRAPFLEKASGDGMGTIQVLINAQDGRVLVARMLTDPGSTPVTDGG
jgi:hypothetical protein